jgi:NlpC/P60 family
LLYSNPEPVDYYYVIKKNNSVKYMRLFITLLSVTAGVCIAAAACNNGRKIGARINANVVVAADTTKAATSGIAATAKKYDSLQIEFGERLAVPYDSIYNLKLYGFIKENLGKKCYGSKKANYSCESFLSVLFDKVYGIEFPVTPQEQMQYNNLELFKNTSYLKPGDIVFFNNSLLQPNKITHAGFYLSNTFFLVGTNAEGIVIRNINDSYWVKHFVAAGRVNKLPVQNN